MKECINNAVIVHISFATFYKFNGWTFEWSRNKPLGPWPAKKDLEPRERCGMKFFNDINEFFNMTEEEQEACRL